VGAKGKRNRRKEIFHGIYGTLATSNNGGLKPCKINEVLRMKNEFFNSGFCYEKIMISFFFLKTQQKMYWKVIEDFAGIRANISFYEESGWLKHNLQNFLFTEPLPVFCNCLKVL
jgi:hypothetical protein